jgi:hypothetical protein
MVSQVAIRADNASPDNRSNFEFSNPLHVSASVRRAGPLTLLTRLQNLHVPLKQFLELGYPNTEGEAEKLLQVVHLRRQETEHRKRTAEKAINRCTLQLEMSQPQTDRTRSTRRELEAYQSELVLATVSGAEAEEDVGLVRTLLRRRGFSVRFTSNKGDMQPSGLMHHNDVGDDSDSDSSDMEGVAVGVRERQLVASA